MLVLHQARGDAGAPSSATGSALAYRRLRFIAAATMGLAHSGVFVRSRPLRMFPCSMCNNQHRLGDSAVAGSASALLS